MGGLIFVSLGMVKGGLDNQSSPNYCYSKLRNFFFLSILLYTDNPLLFILQYLISYNMTMLIIFDKKKYSATLFY